MAKWLTKYAKDGDKLQWSPDQTAIVPTQPIRGISVGTTTANVPGQKMSQKQVDALLKYTQKRADDEAVQADIQKQQEYIMSQHMGPAPVYTPYGQEEHAQRLHEMNRDAGRDDQGNPIGYTKWAKEDNKGQRADEFIEKIIDAGTAAEGAEGLYNLGKTAAKGYIKANAAIAAKTASYLPEGTQVAKSSFLPNWLKKYGEKTIDAIPQSVKDAATPYKISGLDKDFENLYQKHREAVDEINKARYALNIKENKLDGMLNQLSDNRNSINPLYNSIYAKEKAISNASTIKEAASITDDGKIAFANETFGKPTTGTPIINFKTGEVVTPKIELPSTVTEFTNKGKEVTTENKSISAVSIENNYHNTVKSNVDHIENLTGGKVFGSAKGVASADLPHVVGDYDVLISKTNYDKNVKDKLPFIQNTGLAQTHTIDSKLGKAGEIDFNVIEQDENGYATGDRASELFHQFAPDEFAEAARNSIKTDKPLHIPYTADELIAKTDPTIKTIMDAYESTKNKHITKIDQYIHLADPDKVLEAQKQYMQKLVGSKGNIGHQFDPAQLSDVENNHKILNSMNFIGNNEHIAADPKRMQLVLNDFFMNQTTLSRSVNNDNNIEEALKNWAPGKGGQNMGAGLNHVLLGDSQHGMAVYSHKQVSINNLLNKEDPLSYTLSIRKATDGKIKFTADEATKVANIMEDHGVEWGLANVRSPGTLIEHLANKPQAKAVLDEVSKATGIRVVTNGTYGNSSYASTLGNFDDRVDALLYALSKDMPSTKSLLQRRQAMHQTMRSTSDLKTMSVGKFKEYTNILNGADEIMNKRLLDVKSQLNAQYAIRKGKVEKYTVSERKAYDESMNKRYALEDEQYKLSQRIARAHAMRKTLVNLAKVQAGALGVIGAYGLYKNGYITSGSGEDNEHPFRKYSKSGQKRIEDEKKQSSLINKVNSFYKNTGIIPSANPVKKQYGGAINKKWLSKY